MRTFRKGTIPPPELDFGESTLISFYRGREKDGEGRTIEDIWHLSEHDLETQHGFIQWIFPLPQRSRFNPTAPVLCQNDIAAFARDRNLQRRVLRSFDMMLSFYGFSFRQEDGRYKVVMAPDFIRKTNYWLSPRNHNYMRISRMLNFLMLINLQPMARAFFEALQEVYNNNPRKINSAFSYWRAAVV